MDAVWIVLIVAGCFFAGVGLLACICIAWTLWLSRGSA